MARVKDVLAGELRVALSRRAQPIWFRAAKWALALYLAWRYWGAPYFWFVVAGAFCLALTLHFFWRFKTKGWTQPWFGWNDIDAGRRDG